MEVVDLWGGSVEEPEAIPEGHFLVLAGINRKTGRQLYLSTYKDCDEWSISIVPSAMSYTRAQRMIDIARKDIDSKTKQGKEPQYPPFEIVNLEDCGLTQEVRRILV